MVANMKAALIMSFLVPGLGVIYAGNMEKGLLLFGASFVLVFLNIYVLGIFGSFLSFLLWLYSLYVTYEEVNIANSL